MTPPIITEMKCPACDGKTWSMDSIYTDTIGTSVPFSERVYKCSNCGCAGAGFSDFRHSPPEFLSKLGPIPAEEFDYWIDILKVHFPDYSGINEIIAAGLRFPDDLEVPVIDLSVIEFGMTRNTMFTARFDDTLFLRDSDIYLGVCGSKSNFEISSILPRIAKVGAWDVIDTIVSSALPGVQVTPLSTQSQYLEKLFKSKQVFLEGFDSFFRNECVLAFFRLENNSSYQDGICPYWNYVLEDKNIVIRIPEEIPNLEIKMYVDKSKLLRSYVKPS